MFREIYLIWGIPVYALYAAGLGVSQSSISRVGVPAIASNWFTRKRGIAFGTIMAGWLSAGVVA